MQTEAPEGQAAAGQGRVLRAGRGDLMPIADKPDCKINVGYINDECAHAMISINSPVMVNADPNFAQVVMTIADAERLSDRLRAFLLVHGINMNWKRAEAVAAVSGAVDIAKHVSVGKSDNPFEPNVKRQPPLPPESDGVKAAGAAVQRLRG